MMINQIKTTKELKEFQASLGDKKLALVPTMGALHEGHLALVQEATKVSDIVLTYIFVNPTQFAVGEDLDTYPRTLASDIKKLEAIGCDALWLPSSQDIYPHGPEITLRASDIAKPLEGEYRPHFFDGVVTVLARMFELSKPDYVMMGEKDFQQLLVVKKMVEECSLALEIIGVETMRDKNGLALSSRNFYLSDSEYLSAIELNKIMKRLANDEINEEEAAQALLAAGFNKIDYATKRNSENLCPDPQNSDRVLMAAWLGKTRLIDNMAIKKN